MLKPYLRFDKSQNSCLGVNKVPYLTVSKFGRLKTSFKTWMFLQRSVDPSINESNQEVTSMKTVMFIFWK